MTDKSTVPVCSYCRKVIKLMDRYRVLEAGKYHSRCADKFMSDAVTPSNGDR